MLLTEPQLISCLDFTDRRVVMSTKIFFQLGKDSQIRQRHLGDVRGGVITGGKLGCRKSAVVIALGCGQT
jgi:hypothetical protein